VLSGFLVTYRKQITIKHAHVQRPTVFRFFSKPFKQRVRHLRWPAPEEAN
jgi:hypothetical protein